MREANEEDHDDDVNDEEVSNEIDEGSNDGGGEREDMGRGGGRYDLRERVGPPERFVPGACTTHVEVHAAVVEGVKLKASELVIPKHIGEALASPQKEYWKQAMQEELDAIEECDTF